MQTIRSHDAANIRIVVSDAHQGLACTIGEVLRHVAWQRHGGAEGGKPDALFNLIFPPTNMKRLHTDIVQDCTNRKIKRRSHAVKQFPSFGSLAWIAGACMSEQDAIQQEFRGFSEARMNVPYDEDRARGINGPVTGNGWKRKLGRCSRPDSILWTGLK